MRIEGMTVYTGQLPYAGPAYAFAGGRSHREFTTTVVVLTTDTGLRGYGEVCPCGPNYMPAFAEGLPSCLALLAPAVMGEDPRQTTRVARRMEQALTGHAVAKAAIDIACWDLLGKAAGLPVYTLLGGLMTPSLPLHRIVPLAEPEAMKDTLLKYRAAGFKHIQIKLGHAVADDIELLNTLTPLKQPDETWVGDINGGWRRDQALQFAQGIQAADLYLEQPCQTYEECLSIRRRSRLRMKLDECLNSLGDVQRALRDDAMDAMALKVSRLGGLTQSRVVRDICVDAGIPLTIEDAWGSGIATAAYAHLAASTPARGLLNTTDLHNYNTVQLAQGAPETAGGSMTLSDRPGLGVEPEFSRLTAVAEHG